MKKNILHLLFLSCFFTLVSKVPNTVLILGDDDAGKGKVTDYIGGRSHIIVRTQGGNQKGHKIIKDEDEKYNLNLIPVGIVRSRDIKCYLTSGMEIDLSILFSEIDYLKKKGKDVNGRLLISSRAHIVMPYHRKLDELMAKEHKGSVDIGSRKGTGAAASDKRLRIGIRVADLLDKERFKDVLKEQLHYSNQKLTKLFDEKPFDFDEIYTLYNEYGRRLKPFVVDNLELKLNKKIVQGERVVFEGAQGANQDVSLGNYPYVSSSSTSASGICTGAGVGPGRIGHTLGVVKCYATCPSVAPFPSEIQDKNTFEKIKQAHDRSCIKHYNQRYGWIDLVHMREMILLNGIDSLALTKLDDLDDLDEIKICYDYVNGEKHHNSMPTSMNHAKKIKPHYITMPGWKTSTSKATKFSELPENARAFVKKIEILSGIPISYLSVGPTRHQMILLNDLLPL